MNFTNTNVEVSNFGGNKANKNFEEEYLLYRLLHVKAGNKWCNS